MKKLNFLLLFVFSIGLYSCISTLTTLTTAAHAFNPKIIKQLKTEKVVIATTEYHKKATAKEKKKIDEINDLTVDMIKKHWTHGEIHEVLPYTEALKFVRKNDGYYLLNFGNTGYEIHSNGSYSRGAGDYSSIGLKLMYYNSGTAKAAAFETPFTLNENFLNETSVVATVKGLDDMLRQIETKKINSQYFFPENKHRNSQEIKKKTLLIPDYMVNDELGEEGIKKYYKYDFEICNKEKFEDALLNGLEGYMFPLYNTVPAGENTFDQFMIYDSETWECYVALRWAQHPVSNFKIFAATDYHEFLKIDKKTWKLIAKGMKSI